MSPQSNPRLSARSLRLALGEQLVLLEATLQIHAHEIVALIGDNGAGKTSMLDLLAGSHQTGSGAVELDGVPLCDVAPHYLAKRIARLDHKPGLYLDLTARENLKLFCQLLDQPCTMEVLDKTLDTVGVRPADRDRPVRHFSRGMLQRAALARVIASPADIWLLDEPSTGLDASGCAWLAQLLGAAAQRGVAILLASHDPMLIALADRTLHLQHGMIQNNFAAGVA